MPDVSAIQKQIEALGFPKTAAMIAQLQHEKLQLQAANNCLGHGVAANDKFHDTILLNRIVELQDEVSQLRRKYEKTYRERGHFI